MTKEEAEKELIHVVNDILNPYNERESEIEAHLLAEDGWRKVPQAEWIKAECSVAGMLSSVMYTNGKMMLSRGR